MMALFHFFPHFCCHVFVAQTFPVAVSPSKKVASQRTQRNAFDFIPNIKNVTIRVSLKDSIIPRSVWLFSADITRAACFFRILIYCDFCTQLCAGKPTVAQFKSSHERDRERVRDRQKEKDRKREDENEKHNDEDDDDTRHRTTQTRTFLGRLC